MSCVIVIVENPNLSLKGSQPWSYIGIPWEAFYKVLMLGSKPRDADMLGCELMGRSISQVHLGAVVSHR